MKIVDWVFYFPSEMLRIIISGREYSVMCEDYCVIFNTWEGGYYGFIKWIFHVVFSIYKILEKKYQQYHHGKTRMFFSLLQNFGWIYQKIILDIFIKGDIDLFLNFIGLPERSFIQILYPITDAALEFHLSRYWFVTFSHSFRGPYSILVVQV